MNKVVSLLVIAVLLSASLSGCLKKSSKEKIEFAIEISAALDSLEKSKEVMKEAKKASNEGDNRREAELAREMKPLFEDSLNHLLAAELATNDPTKKKYAEYMAESIRNYRLWSEKYVEEKEYLIQGNDEAATQARKEAYEYAKKAYEWQEKAKKLRESEIV